MREGWQQTTLGSLLQRKTTRLGDAKEPRILTVTEGHGLVDQLEHWGRRVATEDVSKYKVVEPNDVVYNVYLLWNGAIGQNLFGDRGVTSPVYEVFSPVMDVEPRLLGLILEEPKLREAFDSISIGTIPRRRRAPWQDFLALPVTLPPLDEQRRIVDLVGALDDAIEAAEQQIRTSEAAGIQARRHAFESVTDTASVAAAGDLFDMLLGRQKSARQTVGDHMIPYLRAANISSQGFLLEDVQTMNFSPPEQEKYGLRPRDVMLVEGGSLGQSSMWMGELGGAVGFDKHVIRLREVPGTSIAEYALQWTRWAYESGAFDAQATGATIRALGFGRAKAMAVPDLSVEEQWVLVEPLEAADTILAHSRLVAESLRTLRSNLLTVLLSGEHEIPASYDELMEEVAS